MFIVNVQLSIPLNKKLTLQTALWQYDRPFSHLKRKLKMKTKTKHDERTTAVELNYFNHNTQSLANIHLCTEKTAVPIVNLLVLFAILPVNSCHL